VPRTPRRETGSQIKPSLVASPGGSLPSPTCPGNPTGPIWAGSPTHQLEQYWQLLLLLATLVIVGMTRDWTILQRIFAQYSSGIHPFKGCVISLRVTKSNDQPIILSILNRRIDHANRDFVLVFDDSLAHFRDSFRWVGVGLLGWSCSHFRSLWPLGLEVFRESNSGVNYDTRRIGEQHNLKGARQYFL
jgi:hypothetical protein